jgi:hypothetical protein
MDKVRKPNISVVIISIVINNDVPAVEYVQPSISALMQFWAESFHSCLALAKLWTEIPTCEL